MVGNLIQASDGKLYGMTSQGGSSIYYGVIFSYDPATAVYTRLYSFDHDNGRSPYGRLVQASDGRLYGMTQFGGIYNYGLIFSYDPATAVYTRLKDFDGNNGANPLGSLIQASDGKLYGMTSQGGTGKNVGVIFSYEPATATYTNLHVFDGTNGSSPLGSLMQASDGKLYGMTQKGGSTGGGVSFSFDPVTGTYTKLADFTGSNGSYPQYTSFVEVCPTYYRDADGDSFGDPNNSTTACSSTPPAGYVANSSDCDDTKLLYADNDGDGFGAGSPVACGVADNTDCNDNDANVHPITYYKDNDHDGFGDLDNSTTVCSSTPPEGYVTNSSDCDDTKLLYADNDGDGFGTGSPVACGVEDNTDCNDNDASVHSPITYYKDNDHDGFGNPNKTITTCSSTPPAGYVANSMDCNDAKLFYADKDGDGFGAGSPIACGVLGNNTDCNDNDATVHKPVTYYKDNDHDGFGDLNNTITACSLARPEGYVTNNRDCNDNDASVHPGAVEICGNGIDDNCNGQVDEGCTPLITIFGRSVLETDKGMTPRNFAVKLNKTSTETISVDYTTQDISAMAGTDYIAQTGTLTFGPGVTSNAITIQVTGDRVPEWLMKHLKYCSAIL